MYFWFANNFVLTIYTVSIVLIFCLKCRYFRAWYHVNYKYQELKKVFRGTGEHLVLAWVPVAPILVFYVAFCALLITMYSCEIMVLFMNTQEWTVVCTSTTETTLKWRNWLIVPITLKYHYTLQLRYWQLFWNVKPQITNRTKVKLKMYKIHTCIHLKLTQHWYLQYLILENVKPRLIKCEDQCDSLKIQVM